MREFMLLIRNLEDSKSSFSPEQQQEFLEACQVYIEDLTKHGQLKSAQPLVREGCMVSGTPAGFQESPYAGSNEVIVGYYHLLANDLDEAIALAKRNPEFAFTSTARIEVRPIKTMEQLTNYTYPTK